MEETEDEHDVVKEIRYVQENISRKNLLEHYHDALERKEQAISMFDLGILSLEDRAKVELLSGQEEMVNDVVKERAGQKAEVDEKAIREEMYQKLREKIKHELKESEKPAAQVETSQSATQPAATEKDFSTPDPMKGKVTIQLGSYQSVEDAEKFAEGFRVRGYNPIISKVQVKGRGLWFRVSLGAFDTVSDAKDFAKQEESLFHLSALPMCYT